MINYNKVISNILDYENPSNYEEIYKCLTLMQYKINDSNVEKYDNLLSLLANEKKDIYPIIDVHSEVPVSKLEKTMDKIINGIIDDSDNDIIFSKFKEKLSETQIQSVINKIKKNISGESYNYIRIKELLKIFDNKIILPVMEEFILDNNINNSKKLSDVFEILKNYHQTIESTKMLDFLNIVSDSKNEKSDIFNFIYEFRQYIDIGIIKKIPNIVVSIMDSNIYNKTFEIYKQNMEIIKNDEVCSNYVCEFLTIDAKNANKVKKSFDLLKKNFKIVKKLAEFVIEYLEYNKGKNNEDEYYKIISYYLINESDANKIYNDVLCKKELTDKEFEKIDKLFEKFEVVFDIKTINNDVYLMNVCNKYIKNKDIKNINLFLTECNSENVISSCLKQLSLEKIKFNNKLKKVDFYNTLISIKNRFNSADISNNIDSIININNLNLKNDLAH